MKTHPDGMKLSDFLWNIVDGITCSSAEEYRECFLDSPAAYVSDYADLISDSGVPVPVCVYLADLIGRILDDIEHGYVDSSLYWHNARAEIERLADIIEHYA